MADQHTYVQDKLCEFLNDKDLVANKEIRIGRGRVDVVSYQNNTLGTIDFYEVKTSSTDLMSDFKSGKWFKYLDYCNNFYFVVPKRLVSLIKKYGYDKDIGRAGIYSFDEVSNKLFHRVKSSEICTRIREDLHKSVLQACLSSCGKTIKGYRDKEYLIKGSYGNRDEYIKNIEKENEFLKLHEKDINDLHTLRLDLLTKALKEMMNICCIDYQWTEGNNWESNYMWLSEHIKKVICLSREDPVIWSEINEAAYKFQLMLKRLYNEKRL